MCSKIIVATACLHNICMNAGMTFAEEEEEDEDNDPPGDLQPIGRAATARRTNLINTVFA